jgi:hypothetical protein
VRKVAHLLAQALNSKSYSIEFRGALEGLLNSEVL